MIKSRPFPNFTYRNVIELQTLWLKSFKTAIPTRMFYNDVQNTLTVLKSKKSDG